MITGQLKGKIMSNMVVSIGWLSVLVCLYLLNPLDDMMIAGLLILFLCVCEFYPIVLKKGTLSYSFPILFTLFILEGLSFVTVAYALIILGINLVKKKTLKKGLLESASRILILLIALLLTNVLFKGVIHLTLGTIGPETLYAFFATGLFYLVKNVFSLMQEGNKDYTSSHHWFWKKVGHIIVFILSFFYCWLFFYMSHQDRGQIDAISIFFFYSPLVGLTIVSNIIVKLEKEKRRLNILFSITNGFKQDITRSTNIVKMITELQNILPIDTSIFWVKESEKWKVASQFGEVSPTVSLDKEVIEWFESLMYINYFEDRQTKVSPGFSFFGPLNKSLIFSPFQIEGDLIGVWGIGSFKSFAFERQDLQSIEALVNQVTIIIRTKKLIEEQGNHQILEERNRIAREIHDGIAQRIAGAVMNLEAANKSFDTRLDESKRLVQSSLNKLRGSLKDLRESIYALRPHPTEQVGLVQALRDQIETFKMDNPNTVVHFQEKGKETPLGYLLENIIFNVLKEALRNIEKHAQATSINVTIIFKEMQVILRVKDNGIGFSLMDAVVKAKNEPHFGIINMHELADNMGSTIDISTKQGVGTEITLVVPKIIEESGGSHD